MSPGSKFQILTTRLLKTRMQ